MAAIPGPADDGGSSPRRTGGENPETVTIRCRLDGPLVVELPAVGAAGEQSGPIRLRVTDHLGQEFALPTHKRAVALCRCGRTKSRPFCDGSHKAVGFEAADLADGGPPPGMDASLGRHSSGNAAEDATGNVGPDGHKHSGDPPAQGPRFL
jgi:CDGSH-type Zn-finger protein